MDTYSKSVLVIDSTGRGHTICDLLVRTDPHVTVYYGPGSTAIRHPRIVAVPEISLYDVSTVISFCNKVVVDFVFVSFINSLALGYVDELKANGIPVVGPTKRGAELEASKEYAKRFCIKHGLKTASYQSFTNPDDAKNYLMTLPYLVVIKVNGLCELGDGAVVCDSHEQAIAAIDKIATESNNFHIIVEQHLFGKEISLFALLDGHSHLLFPTAFDYKRVYDGNTGKNCDGMGSLSPHPAESPTLRLQIHNEIMTPLCRALREEDIPYTGFVYVGAMITHDGLYVLEINTRFGDSEAEVVLPSIQSNFYSLCQLVLKNKLDTVDLINDGFIRCSVAAIQGCINTVDPAALPGWPFGEFKSGQRIEGLGTIDRKQADVFLAGVQLDEHNLPVTTGGRVLHVVGKGIYLKDAIKHAYNQISRISFPGMFYRSDIGQDCI